jgi:HAE1 family hydrophobic/amphiphilic exporter-1
MLSVPLAIIGALGALLLSGMTINIFTMIGMIMLMGLVTKNGILLVDYTNTLRRRDGLERDAALLQAGPVRLRPILMTTLAMIFGMLPIAVWGSETRAPMAVAVIGGLITSTLLTLVVVPVVYTLLDDLLHPSRWRFARWLPSRSARAPAPA